MNQTRYDLIVGPSPSGPNAIEAIILVVKREMVTKLRMKHQLSPIWRRRVDLGRLWQSNRLHSTLKLKRPYRKIFSWSNLRNTSYFRNRQKCYFSKTQYGLITGEQFTAEASRLNKGCWIHLQTQVPISSVSQSPPSMLPRSCSWRFISRRCWKFC